jgi:hypothetical protein
MSKSQLIAAVLVTSVCLSKHLIILNEEILVLLSFVAFLAFCSRNVSESTEAAMEARTVTTLRELQQYLQVQLDTTREVHAYHTACLHTHASLDKVTALVLHELEATSEAGDMVKTLCVQQTRERADTLVAQHAQFENTLHTALRTSFRACAAR